MKTPGKDRKEKMANSQELSRLSFVKIIEEPAPKALRFRYECEGRSAGSLPGANSNQDKKTFPKIKVESELPCRGVVVVSCVTVDPPYRPHPHNLVGKEGCKKGVCTMEISSDEMTCEFSNLGIQCVKKKDIEDSLRIREEIRVDPFRSGFVHKSQPGSIDLNAVRLCFQVFLEGPERGQFKVPLKPVVSEPIYDKKAINDLTIMKLSDCTSPVIGNKEIILLCDKVSKDDIEIRFYEEEGHQLVWEAFGDFQPCDVHKQYAICFKTPPYKDLEITSPVRVNIQLRCPSKETTSVARPFDYLPLSSETPEGLLAGIKRKRLIKQFNTSRMENYIQDNNQEFNNIPTINKRPRSSFPPLNPAGFYNNIVKQEPEYYNNYESYEYRQPPPPVQPTEGAAVSPLPGPSSYYNKEMDMGNISLPNLSDVNLSLLESHLSENFNENMNISGPHF